MMRRFLAAWRFLTIFPVPDAGASPGDGEALSRSLPYFPVVGLVLGLISWAVAGGLGAVLPPMAAAAVLTAVLAVYSGGLHLDGLADSADGLFGTHDRERALAIMRDSRIGAFGALALILALLVKFACLASMGADMRLAVLLAPIGGRSAMLVVMALLPYARSVGLGSIFLASSKSLSLVSACFWLVACLLAFQGAADGLIVLAVWALATGACALFLKIRLGGATGDGYGATCEIAETAILTALAVVCGPGF
ncbi:MAG: adenosylcobinamide-GDP ribazoletransferase [Planctomycetota bacterium]|jgi:adenosylcobinamide-GDP ribazoletransferase|nr:adenosylcobinamide-GDP ribazoletransferase [Planctomycetota bacterium]